MGKEVLCEPGDVFVSVSENFDMYALVTDCSNSTYWYADKIGQEFPLVRKGDVESYVKTFDSYNTGNYIQNQDWDLIVRPKENRNAEA